MNDRVIDQQNLNPLELPLGVFPLLPSSANRKKTANDIDESQDGVIKRMEWLRYIAVLDEGRGMYLVYWTPCLNFWVQSLPNEGHRGRKVQSDVCGMSSKNSQIKATNILFGVIS